MKAALRHLHLHRHQGVARSRADRVGKAYVHKIKHTRPIEFLLALIQRALVELLAWLHPEHLANQGCLKAGGANDIDAVNPRSGTGIDQELDLGGACGVFNREAPVDLRKRIASILEGRPNRVGGTDQARPVERFSSLQG